MNITEIRELTGLDLAKFSRRYNIPYRTLQNWEKGVRKAPQYVVELLEYRIKHEGSE